MKQYNNIELHTKTYLVTVKLSCQQSQTHVFILRGENEQQSKPLTGLNKILKSVCEPSLSSTNQPGICAND